MIPMVQRGPRVQRHSKHQHRFENGEASLASPSQHLKINGRIPRQVLHTSSNTLDLSCLFSAPTSSLSGSLLHMKRLVHSTNTWRTKPDFSSNCGPMLRYEAGPIHKGGYRTKALHNAKAILDVQKTSSALHHGEPLLGGHVPRLVHQSGMV